MLQPSSIPKLELAGLTLTLPRVRLPLFQRLSLSIRRGEIVAVLGPSGVGKSSLIRACLGLAPVGSRVSGSVRLDGRELLGCKSEQWQTLRGGTLGWMTQSVATALEPHARIDSQMVPVLRHLRGWSPARAHAALQDRLHKLSEETGPELFARRWHELSGGQQRLALASLLLCVAPEVLFLDEPSIGLDAARSTQLAATIRAARDAAGLTALVVSHDWRFAHAVADRCMLLRGGALEDIAMGMMNDAPPPVRAMQSVGGDEILRVRGLSKRYRQGDVEISALHELSFTVRARRVLVLWGRTGSGKTTAARCALRLLEPDYGQTEFRGSDLRVLNARALDAMRQHMQLVEQDAQSTIDPKWLVRDIVTEGVRLHDARAADHEDQIHFWMGLLGLPLALLDRRGGELSVGEAQRVAIARAVLLEPELLALDEPSANLDRISRDRLIESIRAYLSRTNGGMLLITHDPDLVKALADEVIELG